MKEIISEEECNNTYGKIRSYQALVLKQPEDTVMIAHTVSVCRQS